MENRILKNERLKKTIKMGETLCLSCSEIIPKGGLKEHGKSKNHKNNVNKITQEKMKKLPKETFTTLDQLQDETLGIKGTPKRDKFDKQCRKEMKKDLQEIVNGKGTLLDIDVMTRKDLQGYSYEKMLDKAYGKKGTPTRIAADKRLKEKAKTMLDDIKVKEAKENEENKEKKSLTKRLKKIKVKVIYHHYRGGKKVKVTKGNMFINQDVADAIKAKDKYKKECIKKSKEFMKFALEFSKKASTLSAGDKVPHVYYSKNHIFRIDYRLNIRDWTTKKIIQTSARLNRETGIIEVSKSLFLKHDIGMRNTILVSLSIGFNWAEIYKNIKGNKDGKPKKSNLSIKSTKVLVKRKPKKGIINKVRKGKKNPVGQKNNKKRKGAK
jgi:hypothetical protein